MYRQSEKNLLNTNISSTSPHNMVNGWDRFEALGHLSKFQWVSRLGFVTAPTSLNGGQPNFGRCLAVSLAGTLYVHFWGLLLPNRILQGAKFTLHPSLALSYIGSVIVWHSSSGHQPNFAVWYKEWNYETFTDGATYLAGRPSRWASAHISSFFITFVFVYTPCPEKVIFLPLTLLDARRSSKVIHQKT